MAENNDLMTGYVMGQTENRGNGGLFGGDGIVGLIAILALLGGGMGGFGFGGGMLWPMMMMGGFGGFGGWGGGNAALQGMATRADINEGFALIGAAEVTTEVKDCVIIFKGNLTEELFQFLEPITDFWWVAFMRLCIGLVQLIQNSFTITVPRVKGMGFYVGFQLLDNIIHIDTPLYLIGLIG